MNTFNELKQHYESKRSPTVDPKFATDTLPTKPKETPTYYAINNLFWYLDIKDGNVDLRLLYGVPRSFWTKQLLFDFNINEIKEAIESGSKDFFNFDLYDYKSNEKFNLPKDFEKNYFKIFFIGDSFVNVRARLVNFEGHKYNLSLKGFCQNNHDDFHYYCNAWREKYVRPLYTFEPNIILSDKARVYEKGGGAIEFDYSPYKAISSLSKSNIYCDRQTMDNMYTATKKHLENQVRLTKELAEQKERAIIY